MEGNLEIQMYEKVVVFMRLPYPQPYPKKYFYSITNHIERLYIHIRANRMTREVVLEPEAIIRENLKTK